MRKILFQVIQYKPFQILVESFVAERVATSPSVFHFRIRTSFQVPGFEWVHELLLLCLTSNSAQFCAEIACGKTALGHNCTDSRFRMKNDFSGRRRGALETENGLASPLPHTGQTSRWWPRRRLTLPSTAGAETLTRERVDQPSFTV